VIVVRNPWTMPQERYNTQWILENNVGLVLPSFRSIGAAVQQLAGRLDEFRSALHRIDNRAVFEVPAILSTILSATRPQRRQVVRSSLDVATAS
jgi:1,2-diacylglycerol 3-beta-galactosyltransferase